MILCFFFHYVSCTLCIAILYINIFSVRFLLKIYMLCELENIILEIFLKRLLTPLSSDV